MEELLQAEQAPTRVNKEMAPQMSIGGWILTFILLSIPLLNIVLLFVWAFDASSERRNFSRAYLIIAGIFFVISIIIAIAAFALGASSGLFSFT